MIARTKIEKKKMTKKKKKKEEKKKRRKGEEEDEDEEEERRKKKRRKGEEEDQNEEEEEEEEEEDEDEEANKKNKNKNCRATKIDERVEGASTDRPIAECVHVCVCARVRFGLRYVRAVLTHLNSFSSILASFCPLAPPSLDQYLIRNAGRVRVQYLIT